MKYAVYVEGLSELLFVADVLQKYSYFDSTICGFHCVNLTADVYNWLNNPKQGDGNSKNFYQIVNVNNDNRVISKLNKDIPSLQRQGFNVIIGLKDVFGEAYEVLTNGHPNVVRNKIEQLYAIQNDVLKTHVGDCRLHFAIMEYEAWMLALIENYVISKGQNLLELYDKFGLKNDFDPEVDICHPYPLVQKIFKACGRDYHKHDSDCLSFLSTLTKDDYEKLRYSGRCASFGKFLDSLLGGECPILP